MNKYWNNKEFIFDLILILYFIHIYVNILFLYKNFKYLNFFIILIQLIFKSLNIFLNK